VFLDNFFSPLFVLIETGVNTLQRNYKIENLLTTLP